MHIFKQNILLLAVVMTISSCEKLVEIDAPIDSITSTEVFSTDEQATSAMAGVYSKMINNLSSGAILSEFSSGLVTMLGALSADELNSWTTTSGYSEYDVFNRNKILQSDSRSSAFWRSAYTTIYGSNAVIEGIQASVSSTLSEGVRKKLTAEAKFVRAFSYFYLVNFFGDVPLVLTIDFNQTRNLSRAPVAEVYKQIVKDLLEAQADLPASNTNLAGEKVFPDTWSATALLARAYLYTKDYENAFKQSSGLIANASQFILETDLEKTFLKESREAIWQLKQESSTSKGNATEEGFVFIPSSFTGQPLFFNVDYFLSEELINTFEADDKRLINWVGVSSTNQSGTTMYFPYKYKTGSHNRVIDGAPTEYYVALRFAEQYLIRAEAAAEGAAPLTNAIDDLNLIRDRAGLLPLPNTLAHSEVLEAIGKERRIELFTEWGHRWLDLKRTGHAVEVLSQITIKQPWAGEYQLFYPIPPSELQANSNLIQNPGYF